MRYPWLPACLPLLLPLALWAQDQPAVTLPAGVRAVWDMAAARHESTATRERICLNGLWRWQPASPTAAPPPNAHWGFFKVPAPWPVNEGWMSHNYQTVFAHPQWRGQNLTDLHAAWYQRELEVPAAWAGRRVTLFADTLNSLATVYLDGQGVGELRWPGGGLDITAAVKPGQRQVLSLQVAAVPLSAVAMSYSDTNNAKLVAGTVEKKGLCGDVWLVSAPAGPRLGDIKIDTSVQHGSILVDAGVEGLEEGGKYVLNVLLFDHGGALPVGRRVNVVVGPTFTAADLQDGRVSFPFKWQPDKLWDLDTPENQLDAKVELAADGGRVLDEALPVRFAFREFWIKGRDFYLNGTRLYLSAVPLDNASVGAEPATYESAKESMSRLKSFGINFVYTHNYGCKPGEHLSFTEVLRAADDVGMLVALSMPHFHDYNWDGANADRDNGYARHAAWYVKVAANHPSVVCYAMSHNDTGYAEDMNPEHIDGLSEMRDGWAMNNVKKALRAEAIVSKMDPERIVYHHSSGNLSSMHTINFYPNWVPSQELDDWFEHWSEVGVKPCFLVEYGAPFGWDWGMYRGWYNGGREFGSAAVPWEYCLAEWNAQFLGDSAYRVSEREKANVRWEAKQFKAGRTWMRWDYPTPLGDARFDEMQPVQTAYTVDNWRSFRGYGLSANSPWEHDRFWQLRSGADTKRRDLAVDWDHLQRPGFSPDYIDKTEPRFDLAYQRSDWIATPTAQALMRNNMPLLGFIAGHPEHFTSKDHIFTADETITKQLIVINNSRHTVTCDASWSFDLDPPLRRTAQVTVPTGDQARVTVTLPVHATPGPHRLSATFAFSTGETQTDTFDLQILPAPPLPVVGLLGLGPKTALFDPRGETAKLLAGLGVEAKPVAADADLSGFDLLVVGKGALTPDGPGPDLRRVRDGLKVICFEQTSAALEQRLGFRTEEYGLRQVWPRVPDHPLLSGLSPELLRDWRGAATLLSAKMPYELSQKWSGEPAVRWCGLEIPRLWRCGNLGNVASVLIEKPPCGDFLAVVDGGYSLQYSPLLVYREGQGLLVLCQMDVTGRSDRDPAAEILAGNLLRYAANWQPQPRRTALYVGEATGAAWLAAAGVTAAAYHGGRPTADQVLVVGPGGGPQLAASKADVAAWLSAGGRMLALGLDQDEANAFLPKGVTTTKAEHLASYFDAPPADSPLAGLGPADVMNRDPRTLPLVTGGAATPVGDGVLATSAGVTFCQLPPFEVSANGGALHSLTVSPDEADAKRLTALVSNGTVALTQFGRKINAGQPGHTYTFRAWVKPLGASANLRLEIERAGRPWDRAVIGPNADVPPDVWTELHATFNVTKPFAEGWQAYIACSTMGARYRADRFALYEGPYAAGAPAAGQTDLYAAPGFEAGLNGWYMTAGPEQFNLRRTWRKSSVMVARLLGNLGVGGATPLLERFGQPVGGVGGASILKNGDFAVDTKGGGVPDNFEFSTGAGMSCTREKLEAPDTGWALKMVAPGAANKQVMLAQHEMPIARGQWYRISWRARGEGLNEVSWTVAHTAHWTSCFDYIHFKPKAEWQTFTYQQAATEDAPDKTKYQFWFDGPGTLWLADLRLEPIADPSVGRWLSGLYLDTPVDWDDPYRRFGW